MLIGTAAMTVALAGCSMTPEPTDPTAAPSPSTEPTAAEPAETEAPETSSPAPTVSYIDVGDGTLIPEGGPGDCAVSAVIHLVFSEGKPAPELLLPENLNDMGPRKFAEGEVGYNDQGNIATYTVAPGDVGAFPRDLRNSHAPPARETTARTHMSAA